MPLKPKVKRGYKVWSLADSETGYLLVSINSTRVKVPRPLEHTLGEHVVLTVAQGAVPAGFQLFLNNLFTATKLLHELWDVGIFACKTFRTKRETLPEVKVDNTDRGSYLWQRKREITAHECSPDVHVMSNYHEPEWCVDVEGTLPNGKKNSLECPQVVEDYNT